MTELARVTVVRDGLVRMYEANGHGLVEVATIRADLGAEDAAQLTFHLSAFLESTSLTIPTQGTPRPRADLSGPGLALEAKPPAPRHTPEGRLAHYVHAAVWFRDNPGSTRADYRNATGCAIKEASNRVDAAKRRGLLRHAPGGVYVATPGLDSYLAALASPEATQGPLTVRPRRARSARGPLRTPDQLEALREAIATYVREHPGTRRADVAEAVGLGRQDLNNLLQVPMARGEILSRKDPESHSPHSTRLWHRDTPPDNGQGGMYAP